MSIPQEEESAFALVFALDEANFFRLVKTQTDDAKTFPQPPPQWSIQICNDISSEYNSSASIGKCT